MTLIVFGYLALLSFGLPLVVDGLLMLALFRWRRLADVLAPALTWPWVFALGFLLLAPLACVRHVTADAGRTIEASTWCDGLLFTYAGGPHYEPPLLPAVLTSVAIASVASAAIRRGLRRRLQNKERSIGSCQRQIADRRSRSLEAVDDPASPRRSIAPSSGPRIAPRSVEASSN